MLRLESRSWADPWFVLDVDGVLVDGTATIAGKIGLGAVGLGESVELSDIRLGFLRAVPVEAIEARGDVLGVKKTSISESDSSSLCGTCRYPGCTHALDIGPTNNGIIPTSTTLGLSPLGLFAASSAAIRSISCFVE